MKRTLFILSGAAWLMFMGCATENQNNEVMSEPAGAERMTNAAPETQARDINQRPYPGADSSEIERSRSPQNAGNPP